MLNGLADKSLVERVKDDRWHLHEVVRQWAWTQPDRSTGKARFAPAGFAETTRRILHGMAALTFRVRLDGPEEPRALAANRGRKQ